MKQPVVLIVFVYLLGTVSCGDPQASRIPVTPRDTGITDKNAFTLLKLDSATVQNYLRHAKLSDTARTLFTNFYNSRNFQYAWFDEKGLTEHASMLWNLYQEYREYAQPRLPADSSIAVQMSQWMTDSVAIIAPAEALHAELEMTGLFFDYAFAKYVGTLDPANLQWYIPRRKTDVSSLLDSLLSGKKTDAFKWEPLHPQYRLLKAHLLDYLKIENHGGWDTTLRLGKLKKLQPGDQDNLIKAIKKRLQTEYKYPLEDSSSIFSEQFRDSVKRIQQIYGLNADGIIGPAFIGQLNVPVSERIKQISINMERLRWLPREPEGVWILVNIPSFRLQVFDHDSSVLQMSIVVGKAATKTVIFSDDLKHIVFSPYWNVPASIVRNEIMPAIKKNHNYLRKSNMEQTGTANGWPVIRQLPGPDNALGKVKFLFPNNYNIYLHDTPAKSYFEQTERAFSHGCVRINKPYELAQFLLRHDSAWTDKKILEAMNSRKEKWVTLKETVPVFITYFTSWIDEQGRLNFRKDIYGHDRRMAEHLFTAS